MAFMKDPDWKTAAATVLLLFFVVALTGYLPKLRATPEAAAPLPPTPDSYQPERMTLEGTLVCLPHAPGAAPTKECQLGLRTEQGAHYAVDFTLMSSVPEPHAPGDRVTGSGVLVPIERLSTDYWRRYQVEGIFSVTDGFKVITQP